jgi:MYXO-CTERM domain-containing protein
MKNLSRSDSLRAVSASSLFVAAVALSAAAPAVADIGVTTSVTREATAAGLTGNYWDGDVSFGSGGTLLSATRPNGATNWPQQYGSWQVSTPQGPPLTGAQIDSWMDSNSRGTFSCTWSVGVGATYPGTYQTSGDFAPYYVAPTARTYLQLTQSSIAQFNDICANGLTGTFTFNTTQDINQAGFVGASFFISGPTAAFSNYVSSGNTLTVTIQSALSTYSSLLLFGGTSQASFQASTNYPFPETARYNSASNTLYQAAPVPAPGALALLGLAGLSGGRRRRG